jgi:polyhydroxybutyrate depolymerase
MSVIAAYLVVGLLAVEEPLGPGDHTRSLKVDESARSYVVHVPPKYDPQQPVPVVLALHGAAMNGPMMAVFSGLNDKADEAGFVAVFPNGTGVAGLLLTWNAGGVAGKLAEDQPDDVAFLAAVLDDLATVVNVDPKRVYAAGMSNGGMMCYRLAAELSDRIAAIAPVGGTMAIKARKRGRPVPVIHFHGTDDKVVPFGGLGDRVPRFLTFKSVEESIQVWVRKNRCPKTPEVAELPDTADDGTTVTRKTYGPGRNGAEVVLVVVEGGGHTWPGRQPAFGFLGKSTEDISANDLIWEFFQKHARK